MGKKDIAEKQLNDYAEVFADIVNVLLFGGERRISPKNLVNAQSRSMYEADGGLFDQERDNVKYWTFNGASFALLGIENQSKQEDLYPFRVISYDGASYRKQYGDRIGTLRRNTEHRKKNEEIEPIPPVFPVVTIVLYFGDEHWTYPTSLRDCLSIPEYLEPYVSDYKINVFEIAWLSDEIIAKFQSDFRYVAQMMTQNRKLKAGEIDKITLDPFQMEHSREVLALLSAMTGDLRFEKAYQVVAEGGGVDMFAAFDIYEQRGLERGREEGLEEGLERGREEGRELGREEGLKQGLNLLKSAIKELGAGVPYEQICSKYGQEIADTAKELVNEDVKMVPSEQE